MRVFLGLLLTCSLPLVMPQRTIAQPPTVAEKSPVFAAGNRFGLDLHAQLDREQPGEKPLLLACQHLGSPGDDCRRGAWAD